MKKKIPAKKNIVEEPIVELPSFFSNHKYHLFILIGITFLLYFNTIFNEYVLDDMIVITHNSFTQKGFAGIKDILFNDTFLGFTGMENQLSGGRYRPLSLVTFAIEYGFLGLNPYISHAINVILYCLCIWLLYRFMSRFMFPNNGLIVFLALLFFTIHPAHTEVVANIKSRDELMCLAFLMLSMHLVFNHLLFKRNWVLFIIGLVCFFLSLLSKENGLVYIAVVPLIFYVFQKKSIQECLIAASPFIMVEVLYFIVRIKITGFKMLENKEILNAPFLYATAAEAFATKVALMSKYLLMLIFPYKMSYDYSFNQIKYVKLSDFYFIFSLVLNIFLLVYSLIKIRKRSVIAFCILFYFFHLALVSNFLIDVGTPFADRFLFQPSLAIAIVLALLVFKLIQNEKQRVLGLAVVGIITIVAGIRTVARNADWKSEIILFIEDVKVCPNSAKTNNNCGVSLINKSAKPEYEKESVKMLNEAVKKIKLAISIHPKYADAYMNLGVAYSRLNDAENAEATWLAAQKVSPYHPKLKEYFVVLGDMYANKGIKLNQDKEFAKAIPALGKAIQYNTKHIVEAWYNLGGAYLMSGNVEKAKEIWKKTLELDPKHAEAQKWLQVITNQPKASLSK